MPWASKAQARWGHSPAGTKALGGPAKVGGWDKATPKDSLPSRATGQKEKGARKAMGASRRASMHSPRRAAAAQFAAKLRARKGAGLPALAGGS